MMRFKRLFLMMVALIMVLNCSVTAAFAAEKKTTMGFNASATTSSSTYEDNAPINRVFYITTGSSSASRTLNFQQSAGSIGYYMYRNTAKSCMQSYRVFVYNDDTDKGKSYQWNWSKSKTIKLEKNSDYIVFVYPESFSTVLNKYLTTKILNLRPIINGFTKSPHFTISTSASIKYSEADSLKIAGI